MRTYWGRNRRMVKFVRCVRKLRNELAVSSDVGFWGD